jgi:hypothetical protein
MRIKATGERLSEEQRAAIGGLARKPGALPRAGAEYVVLGLVFACDHVRLGNGTWVIYQDEIGNPLIQPLALFSVTESTPSRYWQLGRADEVASYALWPPAFERAHFLEDAAEHSAAERQELNEIRRLMNDEAVGHAGRS